MSNKATQTEMETVLIRKYIVKGVEKTSLWLEVEPGKHRDVDVYAVQLDSIKLSSVSHFDSFRVHLPYATADGQTNPQPQIGDVWEIKAEK